jgi:hypothetical protein
MISKVFRHLKRPSGKTVPFVADRPGAGTLFRVRSEAKHAVGLGGRTPTGWATVAVRTWVCNISLTTETVETLQGPG